jgi:hypothetical protein
MSRDSTDKNTTTDLAVLRRASIHPENLKNRGRARRFFERLWLYDQIVFDAFRYRTTHD